MDQKSDTYRTITRASEKILYKDRKSKFYGYAIPVENESEIRPVIERLRKVYPAANHICYAWQLGIEHPQYRASDDGEPNNSAGMPIYGQIQSFELTNVLVTVIRIFGGTKLGVGRLINAYRTAAQMALEAARIEERTVQIEFQVSFPYAEMNKVMQIVKQRHLQIISQEMDMDCSLRIAVRRNDADDLQNVLVALKNVKTKRIV